MIQRSTVLVACMLALAGCSDSDSGDSNPPVADDANGPLSAMSPEDGQEIQSPENPVMAPPAAEAPDDAPPPAGGSTSVSAQLITPLQADGNTPSGAWVCANQGGMVVAELLFFDNGTGGVALSAEDIRRFNWQESPVGSVLMSVSSAGDSQIQSITFSSATTFSATDANIAEVSLGPLNCELLPFDGGQDMVVDGPSPDEMNGGSARQEAIDEANNEAVGNESSADVIQSTIVNAASEFWSCSSSEGNIYSLAFLTDQTGAIRTASQSAGFNWEAVVEAPGLLLISLDNPNDSAIAGISFADTNNFTANLVRFSNQGLENGARGVASCARTAG